VGGLPPAAHRAGIPGPGFRRWLSFPRPLAQDTTLAAVAFTADSLAAWAAAGAAAPPTPGLGTIVIDVRDAVSGAPIPGATVEVVNAGGRSIAQTDRALALRLDLPAGRYAVFARAPGYAESAALADSRVEADAVTFGTMSLETALSASRR